MFHARSFHSIVIGVLMNLGGVLGDSVIQKYVKSAAMSWAIRGGLALIGVYTPLAMAASRHMNIEGMIGLDE